MGSGFLLLLTDLGAVLGFLASGWHKLNIVPKKPNKSHWLSKFVFGAGVGLVVGDEILSVENVVVFFGFIPSTWDQFVIKSLVSEEMPVLFSPLVLVDDGFASELLVGFVDKDFFGFKKPNNPSMALFIKKNSSRGLVIKNKIVWLDR